MLEVYLIMLITSIALATIGIFLVLRNLSMTADGISHSVLLGIVIGFLIVPDLSSPVLLVGAVITGLLTVILVELLIKTNKLKEDAALGIVFPFLFSLGVLIMSRYLRNSHLCIDGVLMGEVLLSPLERTTFFGIDIAVALKMSIITLVLSLFFIMIFYKELKISTFDAGFAILSGFSVALIHYMTMTLVSLNAVIAFKTVGSILVISFMVSPAATAILLTKDLKKTILLTMLIAFVNVTLGVLISYELNINIAGTTAFIGMITYLIAHIIKPSGLLSKMLNRKKQIAELNDTLVMMHISHHSGKSNQNIELGVDTMKNHLKMNNNDYKNSINRLKEKEYIEANDMYQLTEKGKIELSKIKENLENNSGR